MTRMGLEFERKITAGNVLTVIAMVATIFVSLSGISYTIVSTASQVSEIKTDIADQRAKRDMQAAEQEARIRAVEIMQAAQSSDLRAIQGGIARIEAALDKMRGLQ